MSNQQGKTWNTKSELKAIIMRLKHVQESMGGMMGNMAEVQLSDCIEDLENLSADNAQEKITAAGEKARAIYEAATKEQENPGRISVNDKPQKK